MVGNDPLVPRYPHRPIGSIDALARHLGVSRRELERLTRAAPRLYRANPLPKKGGGFRWTYDARPPLKRLHAAIKEKLLQPVEYPSYLQGSIRDPDTPREPLTNADLHAGNYLFIQEDVAGFFGSIGPSVVNDMWRRFFAFPADVSEILTNLTTLKGLVPEGARPSSYIANLALWDVEPQLVRELQGRGFVYSRYVDDVVISAPRNLSHEEKTEVVGRLYGMFAAKGLRAKRQKHSIAKKGQAAGKGRGVTVTGYSVAGGRAAVSKAERNRVRSAVRQIEVEARTRGTSPELQARFQSASSRVDRIARAGSAQGVRLRQRLAELKPSVFPKSNRRDIYGGG
ncbi:MAG: RNA-directed DNA polymerase [Spiribacter salinus]|uniref:RNA-directed DNA polymerase n=1 Tax=Spiribacter salinus TaxID=1335746 RepID=A0A540VQ97_9GAMM|nr:MAG: RNA-directed DNA polymerase [Spiribacter salinus]